MDDLKGNLNSPSDNKDIKELKERLRILYLDTTTDLLNCCFSDTRKKLRAEQLLMYLRRLCYFDNVDNKVEFKNIQERFGLKTEKEVQDFLGDGTILGIKYDAKINNVKALCSCGFLDRTFSKEEVYMEEMLLNPEDRTEKDMGAQIFFYQVDKFREKGYKKLITCAVSNKPYKAAYTWARMGYEIKEGRESDIFRTVIKNLPDDDINKCKTLQELMSTKKGRDFWKEKGWSFNGVFDLTDNSPSISALNDYMKSHDLLDFMNYICRIS